MAESVFILLAMNRKQAFGQLIAEGRARAGLFGKDLAPRLGISASTLSNLETGNFSYPPDPELLDMIEKTIGVPKNQLGIALGYYEERDRASSPLVRRGRYAGWSWVHPLDSIPMTVHVHLAGGLSLIRQS